VSRLVFRPQAVRDMEQIWTWTAGRWGAAQAERYLRRIQDVCAALAGGDLPGADASDIRPGYRKARAGRHLVFFRRQPDASVEVVRILHERMDIGSRLRDE
jgi:toxin ParE1/3/4